MARAFRPCVLTANDLFDGDVVYFATDGAWTRRPRDARLFEAEAAPGGCQGPEPIHVREVLRAAGPSNYRHGKQAGG